MNNNFASATKKIEDLTTLYTKMDALPNRGQWHFEPSYNNSDACAFVFSHTTSDASRRNTDLNMLASVLYHAGIHVSLAAVDGMPSNIIIAPKHADLARKLFARYQITASGAAKTNNVQLEQEWMRMRQK